MKTTTICTRVLACFVLQFALFGSSVQAMPIQFNHSGYGSGTLDGVPFAAFFTIEASADTSNRVAFGTGAFSLDHLFASIDIEGLGVFDFLTATRTYVNNRIRSVGFGRAGGADLFNGPTGASTFGAWDMLTSVAPIGGAGSLVQWALLPVQTSGGELYFDPQNPMRSGFSAIVAVAVPAPGTGLMLILGLVCLESRRRSSAQRYTSGA